MKVLKICCLIVTVALLIWANLSATEPPEVVMTDPTRIARVAPPNTHDAVILQYHHVDTNTPAITSLPPELFAQHLDYIAAAGFSVIPMETAIRGINREITLPSKSLTITFDDAYLSIYETAYPLLAARGWPFTIFVATELVGTNPTRYLSWAQLKEMMANGAVIANHTHSHLHMLRKLTGETRAAWLKRLRDDITTADELISRHLGPSPKLFAYPYGEYNSEIADLIAELGYVGFGQQSGAIGPALDQRILPRFPLSGNHAGMGSFGTKIHTRPFPFSPIYEDPVVRLNNLMPAILMPAFASQHTLHCFGPGETMSIITLKDHWEIRTTEPVPIGRSRYNCTLLAEPGEDENTSRYYWYSHMWFRPLDNGDWYPEP